MDLISEDYRKTQEELHATGKYGVTGAKYAPLISEIVNKLEITHLLDYGCGSNLSLGRSLKVNHKLKYQAYDPCVEKYSGLPVPAEMVCCIDVLEHIEEDKIDDVLNHLQSLVEAIGFFSISTGPASKTLSDGRNAHILQRPAEWWLPRLMCRFDLQTFEVSGDQEFYVVVYPHGQIEDTSGQKAN